MSSTFDVSEGYDMSKAGTYSVAVDTYIEYAVGSVKGMNEPGKPGIDIKISHLSSPAVSFQVVGRKAGNGTSGQRARSLERGNKRIMSAGNFRKRGVPLDPEVVGNAAQIQETKDLHRDTYDMVVSVYSDLKSSSNPLANNLKTWFGGTTYLQDITVKYNNIAYYLQVDTIKYVFYGQDCLSNWFAYTWLGARTVYLCNAYDYLPKWYGQDNKLLTIVHELSHALTYTDDIVYGEYACKALAKSDPKAATKNAESYAYFADKSW